MFLFIEHLYYFYFEDYNDTFLVVDSFFNLYFCTGNKISLVPTRY